MNFLSTIVLFLFFLFQKDLFSQQMIEQLVFLLKNDSSFKVRAQAALTLGKIGGDKVLPPLIDSLKDSHYIVRASGAKSLGNIATPLSFYALLETLNDKNKFVSKYAKKAIFKILKSAKLVFIDLKRIYSNLAEDTDLTGKLYQEALLLKILDHSKFYVGTEYDFSINNDKSKNQAFISIEFLGNVEELEINFDEGIALCKATLSLTAKNGTVVLFPEKIYKGKIKNNSYNEREILEKVIYETAKNAFEDLYKNVFK